MALSVTPTYANDNGAWFFGGLLGGLIIGNSINHRSIVIEEAPPDPVYVCKKKRFMWWDDDLEMYRWSYKKVCHWEYLPE